MSRLARFIKLWYTFLVDIYTRFWAKTRNDSSGCILWTGSKNFGGYGTFMLARKPEIASRLVWGWKNGKIPEKMEIDHICHNRAYLRLATRKQNMENRSGANRNSLTGDLGVTKTSNGYRVRVMHERKSHSRGRFKTIEEAREVARDLRNELFSFNIYDREKLQNKLDNYTATSALI